ncbi:amino acid ABC transporter ATP-binding protein [Georgenia yuyongxinii]|uniref:Amino acid ABC transporter ATP-binding protein n=1 Tax=Georgenia yuyongxinii TaxID=2589797 RepID=A0A5B8BYE1_9MICO|nr:amino acid ABC transporter ATP-binding protein [Georgenia yuyongxinii]QDC23409.1 amino acid ABC transporter ATP-binding protein [Georgenia yuyongxinii]
MSEHPTPAEAGSVTITGLAKSFGDTAVFADVTFAVPAGTVTAIIGPSGSGKSTLLRCINRLETPDAGTVVVDGTRYPAGEPLTGAGRRTLHTAVGMVFQSFNLFPHLTVLGNLTLAQERVLGRSRVEATSYGRELLARVGLQEKADARPATLSGGQQQRVAIARALALDPHVLLFDEPTSALDPELGVEVLGVMRDLAAEGRTMLVVTHEMKFAREVADQVIVMADGGIVDAGDPATVFTTPAHERTRRFLHSVLYR